MENMVIYIPNTISAAAIKSVLENNKHINCVWQLHIDGVWNNKEDFDFNKGFHAITVTDGDDMPFIIEELSKNNIPSYFAPIRFSKRVLNILKTDEQANAAYQNTLRDITRDYIDELCNNSYAEDGSQPTLSTEEKDRIIERVLAVAKKEMGKRFLRDISAR